MHFTIRYSRWRGRALVLASLVAGSGLLAGCNDFLSVENPGAIQAPALEDPSYIPLMVNGVIGAFQPAFDITAYRTAVFTDELRNHATYFEEPLIDQRRVEPTNGTFVVFMYNPLQRSRFLADSVASRLKVLLADSASRDLRLARVQAYAGYSYILLGEYLCASPINMSRAYSSDELLQFAIQRFEEAIPVAEAARAAAAAVSPATTASKRQVAGADSIRNFALVGAARAALDLGDKAKAIQFASQVTPGFEFRSYYAENVDSNEFWVRLAQGPAWASMSDTPFLGLDDPRVPHPAEIQRVTGGYAYVPNAPSAFSTYNGTLTGAEFDRYGSMRVASYLEAQYVLAEAQGLTPTNLEFVNSRRAVGGQEPLVSPTEAEYMAALRDQRRRDFYLDGHRLGDLRRYKKLYGIDEFPSGPYPGSSTITYGDQECLPLSQAEINGNPNL